MNLQPLIISAPFGNYYRAPGFTSTLGTFTLARRAGFWGRLWWVLKTARYSWRLRAWVNRLGLPNPGIDALETGRGAIVSIHGFTALEWTRLVYRAEALGAEAIEFNLSCPNIEHRAQMLEEATEAISTVREYTIAKLPPVRWLEMGKPLWDLGVRTFHLCNTMPTPAGGLSGKPLMQYSLWAVHDFRKTFGDKARLIGGGGVTSAADVQTYRAAGADHVAIGSWLMNPLNWRKAKRFPQEVRG